MPDVTRLPLSGVEVADATIRQLVRMTRFPVSRLLDIAREAIAVQPPPLQVWDISSLEGEAAKSLIEARAGPGISADGVANFLNVSDETVRNAYDRGELIAYTAHRRDGLRFPGFQFDRNGRMVTVHPWVPKLIKAYGGNGWGLLDFLTVPREPTGGLSYLHLIQRGEDGIDQVLAEARRSSPD